jgi:CRISPR system Cascade subunit CasA
MPASLTDLFLRGHEIRDLAVRPHERIAVMRLAMCVAHAALDGPADQDEWETCVEKLPLSAAQYLKKWQASFELLGSGPRFLQVSDLVETKGDQDEATPASKLDVSLATGNNPTLFDNSGGSDRSFTPGQLALMLLTFQAYSPGGTIGVALWNGKPTAGSKSYPKPAPGQSKHAPCLPSSMLHAFVRSDNLLETVHLNLITKEKATELPGIRTWGRPVWEQMPSSPGDTESSGNATATYLGRLVPLSRAIRFRDSAINLLLANALDYPSWPEAREATASVKVQEIKGQAERFLVGASLEKAPWRELNALTIKTVSAHSNGGPIALNNLTGTTAFDLWVGGLVADKAKVLDTVEAVYHVPAVMLQTAGQQCYENGVKFAEDAAWKLGRAVSAYHAELGDNLDRPEARDRRDQLRAKANSGFWTQAERNVSLLLAAVESTAPPSDFQAWRQSTWGKSIVHSCREAYELACPRQSSRQMQAFVKGLPWLNSRRDNGQTTNKL